MGQSRSFEAIEQHDHLSIKGKERLTNITHGVLMFVNVFISRVSRVRIKRLTMMRHAKHDTEKEHSEAMRLEVLPTKSWKIDSV